MVTEKYDNDLIYTKEKTKRHKNFCIEKKKKNCQKKKKVRIQCMLVDEINILILTIFYTFYIHE